MLVHTYVCGFSQPSGVVYESVTFLSSPDWSYARLCSGKGFIPCSVVWWPGGTPTTVVSNVCTLILMLLFPLPSPPLPPSHENVSGFYRVSTFFVAKVCTDMIPMRLFPLLFYAVITYFMVGESVHAALLTQQESHMSVKLQMSQNSTSV